MNNNWMVYEINEMSPEQKSHFIAPDFSHINSAVVVAKDISDTQCEQITIGENTHKNREQAAVICAALNEANL